tara:strand:+ start:69 stop:1415 length:1347 start_codon:yes stop_codon:yes gene_type:complete
MASTKLTRTNGTSTNLKKWTWSAWIKRGLVGTQETFVVTRYDDNNYSRIRTDPDVLQFEDRFSSNTVTDIRSTEVLRDPSAWYHVVVRIDYTQSNAADRARMYVNGTEVTYATTTRQSQNGNSYFNDSTNHALGHYNNNNYFNGCMSHVHFTDGYSYGPDTFGSTDATTGQWKINTSPSVTYGNNGYFVLKDANGVTDQSGNSNNFTVGGGTLTQTEDCPSNVFCTMNPLQSRVGSNGVAYPMSIFSNGNTKVESSNTSAYTPSVGTLGASSGKYYFECKMGALGYSSFADTPCIGIKSLDTGLYDTAYDDTIRAYSIAGNKNIDGTSSSFGNTFTTNDIIGVAMDLDNGAVYFSKNGTWENSGDPTSGSSKTGALATDMASYENWSPFAMGYKGSSGSNTTFEFNFGNGYFGTTAISSEGTNASNIGKFEYDVPTGYTALSTKGLNE